MPVEWNPPVVDFQASGVAITAANLNKMGNSLLFLEEIAYGEFSSDVNVTATTDATANQIVSAGAITYQAVPHIVEFFAIAARPDAGAAGRALIFILADGTTALGRLGQMTTPAAANMLNPVHLQYRFTPSAASHTYNIRGMVTAGTGVVSAGVGGSGVNFPGYIRITRIPT